MSVSDSAGACIHGIKEYFVELLGANKKSQSSFEGLEGLKPRLEKIYSYFKETSSTEHLKEIKVYLGANLQDRIDGFKKNRKLFSDQNDNEIMLHLMLEDHFNQLNNLKEEFGVSFEEFDQKCQGNGFTYYNMSAAGNNCGARAIMFSLLQHYKTLNEAEAEKFLHDLKLLLSEEDKENVVQIFTDFKNDSNSVLYQAGNDVSVLKLKEERGLSVEGDYVTKGERCLQRLLDALINDEKIVLNNNLSGEAEAKKDLRKSVNDPAELMAHDIMCDFMHKLGIKFGFASFGSGINQFTPPKAVGEGGVNAIDVGDVNDAHLKDLNEIMVWRDSHFSVFLRNPDKTVAQSRL